MKKNANKDVLYVLTGDNKPPSFLLQTRDTPRRRLFAKGTNRPIRYSVYHDSPYMDEQTGEIGREPIVIEYGAMIVNGNNTPLINFLNVHPQNGDTFIEYDHEKIAKEQLDELDIEFEAESFARNADISVLSSILRVISSSDVDNMTSSEIRRDAIIISRRDPELILSASKDPSFELKDLCHRAVSEGHLGLRNGERDIYYNFPDKKSKILSVPMDIDWVEALEKYLQSEAGLELYGVLKKMLS